MIRSDALAFQNYSTKFHMQTRQDIFNHLRDVVVELFEVEPDAVRPEARLYEDLDIDSIDAADLMVSLREYTGRKIYPEDFKSVRTVGDVIDAVHHMLQ